MAVLFAGCTSIHVAPSTQPMPCATDPALVSAWTDARMTPLGPAWVRFSFGPDCTVRTRVQLLYARITETARYQAQDGVISFERRGGSTQWPYRIESGRLMLQESGTERYAYRRR